MLAKNEVAKIYDTILSIPGMQDDVKINLKTSRKHILLLSKIIERGLHGKDSEDKTVSILEVVPPDVLQEFQDITAELLSKAGLTEMNEKLKTF